MAFPEYTVTAYDPFDSTRTCSDRISVNDPSFVKPIFPAADTITCAGQPVMIGAPNVRDIVINGQAPDYRYNLISNPVCHHQQQYILPCGGVRYCRMYLT